MFTDAEKKEFLNSFIERIDIHPEELENGRFLKHIKFRFSVFLNGQETQDIGWDEEPTVETVVTLTKWADSYIHLEIDPQELEEAAGQVSPADPEAKEE